MRHALAIAIALTFVSGSVLAQDAPPAAPTPPKPIVTNPLGDRPLSAEEQKVLAEVEKDFNRYNTEAKAHQNRMKALLLREFNNRKGMLEKRYADRLKRTTADKRTRHLEAIALLEKFVKDHPNHPKFTPDAMFRLADLYLDESNYQLEQEEEKGNLDVIADYSKSIGLWNDIITKFWKDEKGNVPGYRQMAGVLYLLGHYGRVKDERKSLLMFLSLTCSNKFNPTMASPPEMTREQVKARLEQKVLVNPYQGCVPIKGADTALTRNAWVRGIADHHFTVPGELDESIAAYAKVAYEKRSPLYEEAMYKLAWSYYRRDFLVDAIKHFDTSIKRYDEIVAKGKIPRLDLRKESLEYIAVSFTDPWDGELEGKPAKAYERASKFYDGREKEKHVRDVWITLGDAFAQINAYTQAIDCYRRAISKPWALAPDNPMIHQKIIDMLEGKGDDQAANDEAGKLATRYAPGSPWYIENEKDRKAMQAYRQIGERLLYGAAKNTHKGASELRQEWIAGGKKDAEQEKDWRARYALAVKLYKSFLRQYPTSDKVYEFTFSLAEALFWSGKYIRKGPIKAEITGEVKQKDDAALVTFNKGTADGVLGTEWSAQLLDKDGQPVAGGDFDLVSVSANSCTALVELPEKFRKRFKAANIYQDGAVDHYRWVREHKNLSEKFFQDAAAQVIASYESEVDLRVAAGSLAALTEPKPELIKTAKPVTVPPIYQKLRRAYDKYITLVSDPKTAPNMGINAALVSFMHMQIDETAFIKADGTKGIEPGAIARFEKVFTKFCGKTAAMKQTTRAKDALLLIYQAQGKNKKFRALNKRFIDQKCGDAQSIALAEAQNRSLEFKEAEAFFTAKDYKRAALAFYVYYKTTPAVDPNLPLALFNSAVAYREAGRPKTAIHLFEEFTKQTDKKFRESAWYLVALRQTAVSYQSIYDYDTAVTTYLKIYNLIKRKPSWLKKPPALPGEKAGTLAGMRLEAIFNAASLRELDRKFTAAVGLYRKYEAEEPNRRLKDRAAWAVARIYRLQGNLNKTNQAYARWRNKYGRDKGNEDDYVATYHNLAVLFGKKGSKRDAARFKSQTMKAWKERGSIKGSRGAELAGGYALQIAENYFNSRKWAGFNFKRPARTGKIYKKQLAQMGAALDKVQSYYAKYDADGKEIGGLWQTYGVPVLAMAQWLRIGDSLFQYSDKVYNWPTPKFITPEQQDVFEEGVTNKLKKYVVGAKANWKNVLSTARAAKVDNKWVRMARENLNREWPKEFPILHDPKIEAVTKP